MKLRTEGLHPKVPTQAIVSLIAAALAYYGIDLDPEVSAAIGVVLGFVAGILAPAAPATARKVVRKREAGYGVIELLVALILLLLFVWLVVALVH